MNIPLIPYFQTTRYRVETMIELANIKPGELAADLGSGDGRILIALAKADAIAHGYELDEKLITVAKHNITQSFLHCHSEHIQQVQCKLREESHSINSLLDSDQTSFQLDSRLRDVPDDTSLRGNDKGKIVLHNTDFWKEDLSKYSIITIYGMPDIMEELEQKLQKELKPGARVLSNYYSFPTWKETTKKDNVYLYLR